MTAPISENGQNGNKGTERKPGIGHNTGLARDGSITHSDWTCSVSEVMGKEQCDVRTFSNN